MPARSIDTATIAFGLVSIPVKIYSTHERAEEVHFHMIHAGCGQRLKQFYECPVHGRVEREDMAKGFELTKNHYVEVTKDELRAIEAVSSDAIEIREFVPIGTVDPLLVDTTYYLGPGKGGDRAYRLLRDALEDTELAGIAAYSARGKEHVVMVRPFENGLAMHQLRYPDEVKKWSEVPLGKLPKPASAELELAVKIVEQLRHDAFDPSQYVDEVKGRVRELVAGKAKGGEIVAPEKVERPAAPDLMAALKASLESGKAPTRSPNGHAKRTARTARSANGHAQRTARASRSRPQMSRAKPASTRARAHR